MNVVLQSLSAELLDRMITDPAAALVGIAVVAPAHCDWLKEIAAMSRDFYQKIGAQPPWTGYFALDRDTREVVGTCGFKGNPDGAGTVEIAYATLKSFEGRGAGTAMAGQLTTIAVREAVVRRVIAHTLPERNASCRVLEKSGYAWAGEEIDPEDGKVWRWEWRSS